MGKLKSLLIIVLSICCVILCGTSTSAGEFLREASYFSASGFAVSSEENSSGSESGESGESSATSEMSGADNSSAESAEISAEESESVSSVPDGESEPPSTPAPQKLGKVITRNRTEGTDDVDYSQFTDESYPIYRYNFGYFNDPNIITLSSGAQVRNFTDKSNEELLAASLELPELLKTGKVEAGSEEPQVLIYHTHTSESFLPHSDSYDKDYPIRSSDCGRNMTAVGDKICEALAERGISSVHDCTVHDYPIFTGAYYRSADTLTAVLEEYPSIKIAIDIHRDGILNSDGSVTAPTAEINGKTAAQFMIISCCESEDTAIPNYISNFKTACLIQNCAESAYPGLARPILFDYRNYNQALFEGCLLIEVGSQGNSLDEALYTGTLLGNILADSLYN